MRQTMDAEPALRLPPAFIKRMREDLGAEADAFFESYSLPRAYGLRRNPLKAGRKLFEELVPFALEPVSWADEGYYCKETERPGKHVFHDMGLYYIQEPSAMCTVQAANPLPGEAVLDLCAAPGGKSTHIAGRMGGSGILVCNEIVPARARILSQNIERMGIKNAIVLCHAPRELEKIFGDYFDRIIVDAPCSGEGMFKKEEAALEQWSPENIAMCAGRQLEILSCAVKMLRPGGTLAYSTCTFSKEENEYVVSRLLEEFREMEPSPIDFAALGISEGGIPCTGRIYPHRQRGEGHFVALLKKRGDAVAACSAPSKKKSGKKSAKKNHPANCRSGYEAFAKSCLNVQLPGKLLASGDQLYLLPDGAPDLDGLRVIRPGLHLGTEKKGRFEPGHALALALRPGEASQTFETDAPLDYLRGLTLPCDPMLSGWTLVTYRGLPLGWGKAERGVMKNHYPKGLRRSQ